MGDLADSTEEFRPCGRCVGQTELCPSCAHNRMAIALLKQQIPRVWVANGPDIAARMRDALAAMTLADRHRTLEALQDGYCRGCGAVEPPRCHCENDE